MSAKPIRSRKRSTKQPTEPKEIYKSKNSTQVIQDEWTQLEDKLIKSLHNDYDTGVSIEEIISTFNQKMEKQYNINRSKRAIKHRINNYQQYKLVTNKSNKFSFYIFCKNNKKCSKEEEKAEGNRQPLLPMITMKNANTKSPEIEMNKAEKFIKNDVGYNVADYFQTVDEWKKNISYKEDFEIYEYDNGVTPTANVLDDVGCNDEEYGKDDNKKMEHFDNQCKVVNVDHLLKTVEDVHDTDELGMVVPPPKYEPENISK